MDLDDDDDKSDTSYISNDPNNPNNDSPLSKHHLLDVYCISANDYLKVAGLKPATDGPPNTFYYPSSTNIPSLHEFVRKTTAVNRVQAHEMILRGNLGLLGLLGLLYIKLYMG